jgi:hypothetical protein
LTLRVVTSILSENETSQPIFDSKYMCGEVTLAHSGPWGSAYHGEV